MGFLVYFSQQINYRVYVIISYYPKGNYNLEYLSFLFKVPQLLRAEPGCTAVSQILSLWL